MESDICRLLAAQIAIMESLEVVHSCLRSMIVQQEAIEKELKVMRVDLLEQRRTMVQAGNTMTAAS